ncbi:alpha/beta hydrolase [Nonomuraea sp. ZG12]|uniref:alpha/beta hydrolase n=1 Tax=Nonomuraea sp. ZG12 TaxID=3452207 RepID=UPI003F8BEDDB
MRRLFAVILVSIIGLLGSAVPDAVPASAQAGGGPEGTGGYDGQRLAWSACGGGFQCAKVKVPLDHAKPQGKRIEIAVIRLRAKGPKRIGSLLLNPGGPGASGVELARNAKRFLSPALLARFDVVGFDPRGVGLSSPVRCVSYGVLDSYHALDPTPDTPSEVRKGDAYQQIYAQGCKANSGRLLAHVGTRDAARDIDVLRAALGDRRLTYLGFSYGTLLGATYAELFPKRVRAMVLDGAIDPATRGGAPGAAAHGFETAFTSFLRDCYDRPGCPFRTHKVSASFKQVAKLFKRADRSPLRNDLDGRQVNEALVWRGVMAAMYSRERWPSLRAALGDAFKGDGTALLTFADGYNGRLADGSYDNSGEAFTAVNCADYPPTSRATRSEVTYVPESRYFGKYFSDGLLSPCAFWPVKGAEGIVGRVRAKGAPPILVVGTTRDPATPYKDAEALAGQLSSGVLLGYDGDGHTAYGGPSTCVNGAVDRYLISRVPPKDRTLCRR